MSERPMTFEEWWKGIITGETYYPTEKYDQLEACWNARQPEVDAANTKIEELIDELDEYALMFIGANDRIAELEKRLEAKP